MRKELPLQTLPLTSKPAELSARITDSTTYRLEKSNNNTASGHRTVTINSGAQTVILTSSPSPTTTGSTSSDEGVGGIVGQRDTGGEGRKRDDRKQEEAGRGLGERGRGRKKRKVAAGGVVDVGNKQILGYSSVWADVCHALELDRHREQRPEPA